MVKHNDITLGSGSPLLTPARAKRKLTPFEADIQKAAVALLVGKAVKGRIRQPGDGMTTRWPELYLLHAINPNRGGNNSPAARGMAKAMGGLPGIPDLSLPVPRGPFHGLYLEAKRPGLGRADPQQQLVHGMLREQGFHVVEVRSVEEIVDIIAGWLVLPRWHEGDRAERERWIATRLVPDILKAAP